MRYIDIEIYDLSWGTVNDLRDWFATSFFDTEIIAKVAMARMKLN